MYNNNDDFFSRFLFYSHVFCAHEYLWKFSFIFLLRKIKKFQKKIECPLNINRIFNILSVCWEIVMDFKD